MPVILSDGTDAGILLDGEWRCGDCLSVWTEDVKLCPCWIPTPEEIAKVERDRIVRNGGKAASRVVRRERGLRD